MAYAVGKRCAERGTAYRENPRSPAACADCKGAYADISPISDRSGRI